MYLYEHDFLFYAVGYNPLLLLFLLMVKVSLILPSEGFLHQTDLCVLFHVSAFFKHFLASLYREMFLIFTSCFSPRIKHFFKEPQFLQWKIVCRRQDLSTSHAYCYWKISDAFKDQSEGIYIFIHVHIHVHIYLHIFSVFILCLSVYFEHYKFTFDNLQIQH